MSVYTEEEENFLVKIGQITKDAEVAHKVEEVKDEVK
jgi:hypothetical protein